MIGRKREDEFVDEATAKRLVSGNCEVGVNLTDRRYIKMTAVVYSDDTPDDLSRRIDAMQDQLDRQVIRCDIVVKEAQIAMEDVNLRSLKEGYAALVDMRNKGRKITSQQKMQIDNFDQTLEKTIERRASLEAAIAEGKKKLALNGAAAPSP